MHGLQYQLSIPKYLVSKIYHRLTRGKAPPIFPNLKFCEDLPEPSLNGANWVKLKSLLSGICGSDQNMLRGDESFSMEPFASFPCVLGHENVSEVVEIGSGVRRVEMGDIVIVNPTMGCRVHEHFPLCRFCGDGLDSLCERFADSEGLGAGMSLGYHRSTGGGWSNYYQAHEWQLHKISNDIPLERAVLADPFSSAMQPVCCYADGKSIAQRVLVYGGGTIGLLTVAAIRALKLPWKILVVYRYPFQGEAALELGADKIFRSGSDLFKNIASETGAILRKVSLGKPVLDGGVDAVFDCVGSPHTLDDSLRLCKTRGTLMMVATSHRATSVDVSPIWFREIRWLGTCMSSTVQDPRTGGKRQVYDMIAELLPSLSIEKLLTHTFSLSQYRQALRTAMNKKGKPVVKVAFKNFIWALGVMSIPFLAASFSIVDGQAADLPAQKRSDAYTLCRHGKQVRAIRIEQKNPAENPAQTLSDTHKRPESTKSPETKSLSKPWLNCQTVYTKLGVDRIVGEAQHTATCHHFLKNIKANLERAEWRCRSVASVNISRQNSSSDKASREQ